MEHFRENLTCCCQWLFSLGAWIHTSMSNIIYSLWKEKVSAAFLWSQFKMVPFKISFPSSLDMRWAKENLNTCILGSNSSEMGNLPGCRSMPGMLVRACPPHSPILPSLPQAWYTLQGTGWGGIVTITVNINWNNNSEGKRASVRWGSLRHLALL